MWVIVTLLRTDSWNSEHVPGGSEIHRPKTIQFWSSMVGSYEGCWLVANTLPETNSEFAPENGWLEYYFPIGMAYF